MRPIVDGIHEQYGDQVPVIYLNAFDGGEGEAAFKAYGLRGHPAIVIVTPSGAVSWQANGVISAQEIEQAVIDALEN